jgi:FkbM family methyltransferase
MRELRAGWGVEPTEILHVGAHRAEELARYIGIGCRHVYWVEAQAQLAEALKERLDLTRNTVIEAAVWSEDDVALTFNIANNSESSSLLEFGTHGNSYPKVFFEKHIKVITKKLDSILPEKSGIDFINLDIQGAELNALKGYSSGIQGVKWIYMEVNSRPVYAGCAVLEEIDAYLGDFGFERKTVRWWKRDGWGDALYIHRTMHVPAGINALSWRAFNQILWKIKNLARILLKR